MILRPAKYIFVIAVGLGIFLGNTYAADSSLNDRWIGTWQAAGEPRLITITKQSFAIGKSKFKWSSNITKENNGCFFSYSGRTSKADLTKQLDDVRKGASDPLNDKKARARISKIISAAERTLKDLNPGNYKAVSTACLPDESGGDSFCSPIYFLDQDKLYETGPCTEGSDNSIFITSYSKK